MPLTAVTLREIERVFEVLDRVGLSREAVVIPLRPEHPGRVRVIDAGKNRGKLEIVVDAEVPLDDWLPELERRIRAAMDGGAGDA